MPETPCQKCKRERDELAAKLIVAQRTADTYRQAASAAEAEFVRLREECGRLEVERDTARLQARAAVNDLAAANALLERWYRDYAKQSNLSRETKAHLSGAAPAPTRVADLERALGQAIERLSEFLQAFEGAPDPSENDTKRLVARLADVLHNEPVDGQRQTPPQPGHDR